MLCNWEPHENYQKKLLLNLILFCETERSRVISMSNALSKLYLRDLDNLLPVIIKTPPLLLKFIEHSKKSLQRILEKSSS